MNYLINDLIIIGGLAGCIAGAAWWQIWEAKKRTKQIHSHVSVVEQTVINKHREHLEPLHETMKTKISSEAVRGHPRSGRIHS